MEVGKDTKGFQKHSLMMLEWKEQMCMERTGQSTTFKLVQSVL